MILQQVRDEMNQVNHVLDEFESVAGRFKGKARRRELLQRALLASRRGVKVLKEEQWTKDLGVSDFDPYRTLETMRQDQALLRAFVEAECRLLKDIGVDPTGVQRVRQNLELVLLTRDAPADAGRTTYELEELIRQLERDLADLHREGREDAMVQRLIGVLETLGGGLLVGGNTAAGAAGAPVTFGLSIAGAAVSVAAGTEMISRGAQKALD
jgi:hypothetical protein